MGKFSFEKRALEREWFQNNSEQLTIQKLIDRRNSNMRELLIEFTIQCVPGVAGRLCTESGLPSSEEGLAEFREPCSPENEDACEEVGVPESDCALIDRASIGGTAAADISDDIVITCKHSAMLLIVTDDSYLENVDLKARSSSSNCA